ncbi:MAG: M48 family metallopeptidase [Deltaproteobacteria bacterium]|nr:M48 family metallopeptidase [Deltaproteobacteria bacterium]
MATRIATFADCVSQEERDQRFSVTLVNVLLWLMVLVAVIGSMGLLLLFILPGWLIRHLLSEYMVRSIQALGATVSEKQFPEVHRAAGEVLQRFGATVSPRIVVVGSGEVNALAIKFARRRVIVLLSELLEGIIDNPAQLRFLLAHECCHHALDHGPRGMFEMHKSAKYRQARELTCDNAGLVAANDAKEARGMIRRLCVGHRLSERLDEQELKKEARSIYTGFSGWLLRRKLSHPPAGARISNIESFANRQGMLSVPSAGIMQYPLGS